MEYASGDKAQSIVIAYELKVAGSMRSCWRMSEKKEPRLEFEGEDADRFALESFYI